MLSTSCDFCLRLPGPLPGTLLFQQLRVPTVFAGSVVIIWREILKLPRAPVNRIWCRVRVPAAFPLQGGRAGTAQGHTEEEEPSLPGRELYLEYTVIYILVDRTLDSVQIHILPYWHVGGPCEATPPPSPAKLELFLPHSFTCEIP